MPTHDANQSFLERLKNSQETEVSAHELREMLDAELSKPADEIDMSFVEDMLALLDDYEPASEAQTASWNAVLRKVETQRRKRRFATARSAAGIAAAVVIAFALFSIGTAKAFRWTFLLKWLEPLAETFGIHTELSSPEPTVCPADVAIGQTTFSQTEYSSLEEMPAEIDGYAAIPGWVPERFAFSYGLVYQDENMTVSNILFTADGEWMSIIMTLYHTEQQITDFEYEKTIGEHIVESIGGFDITVYHNANDGSLFGSWIDRDASYSISGSITDEELKNIIENI